MSDNNKGSKLDQAMRDARSRAAAPAAVVEAPANSTASTAATPVNVELETIRTLGLAIFDSEASGDVQRFDAARFQGRLKTGGHTMVERFLVLEEGWEVVGYLLGSSAAVLPAIDGKGFTYLRKLHLELASGARVSQLEAAQLRGLFELPKDGSCQVVLVCGSEIQLDGNKRMRNWGCSRQLDARKPTHESGKAYEQVASESLLKATLSRMRSDELLIIDGAPDGLIAPYLSQALARERRAEEERELEREHERRRRAGTAVTA